MKRGFCIILAMILSISMSGCWSRHEPKTLALLNSAVYDLNDSGGYQITAEIVNPAADGGAGNDGSGKNPSITAVGEGNSFPEGVRNISESVERTVFGGHIKVRLFSEKLVQDGIGCIMDYMLRDTLTDENPLMVVIRDDEPRRIYSSRLGLSDTVGSYIDNLSETQINLISKAVFIKSLDFIKDYYREGKHPVAGALSLVECEEKPSQNVGEGVGESQDSQTSQGDSKKEYRIIYEGLAAFKDDKLVGYLDETETRSYNFITDNIKQAVVTISSEESQSVVVAHDPKVKKTVEIKDDGLITLNVEIKTHMSLVQENNPIDISEAKTLDMIEEIFNEQLTYEITKAVKKVQTEFQSDIFGFGSSMHKKSPKEWDKVKENWDDHFSKAVVNVSVKSTIDRSGEIKQPFKLELET